MKALVDMRTKIGDAAIEVMRESGRDYIGWGDTDELHDIFNRSGSQARRRIPTDAWQHVLNALSRDERFEKGYFRGHTGAKGGSLQARTLRYFKLKAGTCSTHRTKQP